MDDCSLPAVSWTLGSLAPCRNGRTQLCTIFTLPWVSPSVLKEVNTPACVRRWRQCVGTKVAMPVSAQFLVNEHLTQNRCMAGGGCTGTRLFARVNGPMPNRSQSADCTLSAPCHARSERARRCFVCMALATSPLVVRWTCSHFEAGSTECIRSTVSAERFHEEPIHRTFDEGFLFLC